MTQVVVATSSDGVQPFVAQLASPDISNALLPPGLTLGPNDNWAIARQYGDWAGLTYYGGTLIPAWADNSAGLSPFTSLSTFLTQFSALLRSQFPRPPTAKSSDRQLFYKGLCTL